MKINSINNNYKANFGATPNRILYDYIQKSLPKANSVGASEISMKILDKVHTINSIFSKKNLNMQSGEKRIAAINLDDTFLTTIDKNVSIFENLDKIIEAMRGRMRYLKYKNKAAYDRTARFDLVNALTKKSLNNVNKK